MPKIYAPCQTHKRRYTGKKFEKNTEKTQKKRKMEGSGGKNEK